MKTLKNLFEIQQIIYCGYEIAAGGRCFLKRKNDLKCLKWPRLRFEGTTGCGLFVIDVT